MDLKRDSAWRTFFKQQSKELKKQEEYKHYDAKKLTPIISKMWEDRELSSELEIEESEIPEAPEKKEISEDIKKEIKLKSEFDYQCSKCGHMFNGKPEACEKCGMVFKYE